MGVGGAGGPGSRTTDYGNTQATETHHAAAHKKVADKSPAAAPREQLDSFVADAATGHAAPLGNSFPAFAKAAGASGISKLIGLEVKTLVDDPRSLKTDQGMEKLATGLVSANRGPEFDAHALAQAHDQFGVSAKQLFDALPHAAQRNEFIKHFGADLSPDDKLHVAKSVSEHTSPEALHNLFVGVPSAAQANKMADAIYNNGSSVTMKAILTAAGSPMDSKIASPHFDARAASGKGVDQKAATHVLHEAAKFGLNADDVKLYVMGGHSPKVDHFIAESRDAGAPGVLQTVEDMNALRDTFRYSAPDA